ncbi:MAG: DUF4197 domain-containing protein [Bacteroidia bacterium]|nr:DUF4197 domain-containing protein [Bacteroidia bacterium]
MKQLITFFLFTFVISSANSQSILDKAKKALGKGSDGSVTETEAGNGIKEALNKGISTAVSFLNKKDGFLGNEFYKVLFPEEAQKIEKTLRSVGLGKLADDAIVSINRGAEDAVGYATPIFVDAIKQMTITDALKLLKGEKNGATEYFRSKTSAKLKETFLPIVKSSLEKVDATKYYDDMVNKYNSLPTTFKKLNPDLADHVTDKTIYALFDRIAVEEANIRDNPAARTSDLLKKVFGGSK